MINYNNPCIPRMECEYAIQAAKAAGLEYLWLLFLCALASLIGIYCINKHWTDYRPVHKKYLGIAKNGMYFIFLVTIPYIIWTLQFS